MSESEGHGVGDAAREFVRNLAEKAGIEELKAGLEAVEHAARAARGVEVEVWTAVPLTDAERTTLEARLSERFGADLERMYHVDPSLLGGVIVRVGDRYLDGSLATKLGQLRQELLTGRMS